MSGPPGPSLRRVAFLGNHPPRLCGLATFNADLRSAVAGAAPDADCFALAMTDRAGGPYDYPPEVRLEVPDDDLPAYRRAADFLNDTNADVLCLQHEYGIFGGADGGHVLALLERARLPVVTALHTVLDRPTPGQRKVMDEIIRGSARLVVMTERSRALLNAVHGVRADRVAVVPHGIPETPFFDPNYHKDELGAEGRTVLLTFGLLSPGKGIEHAIRALPRIAARRPDVLYIVLGATHPNLLRREGEAYRDSLSRLAGELGVAGHLRLVDGFVDLPTLTRAIAAADVYLTPYLNEAQSVSGTLAYSFGMGKPVVSTPYWHAADLLANGRGELVPFADPMAIAEAVSGLLDDPPRMHAMRKAAYTLGREVVWPRIGERYLEVFREARLETPARLASQRRPVAAVGARPAGVPNAAGAAGTVALVAVRQPAAPGRRWGAEVPPPKLGHLARLLDSTGVAQHAVHTVVDRDHGYCLDDNARGLMLAALLPPGHASEREPLVESLFDRTAAFVQHAWNAEAGRFRNFMAFDRRWLEAVGSEDSHGRAVWALGAVAGRAAEPSRRAWAQGLLERAAEVVTGFAAPRAWAFALLGAVEYLAARPEDLRFVRLRTLLAARLHDRLAAARGDGWTWFEDILSYDNARLPQALVAAGRQAGRPEWRTAGLEALGWLCDVQRAEEGHFSPVGSEGFWRRGGARAAFDQQPLEAGAAVGACLEAWRATGAQRWLAEARRAHDWFLGDNDLREPLHDRDTGGCRDGLLCDRVNANQGAESTLAFLLATAEMRAARAHALPRSVPGGAAEDAAEAALLHPTGSTPPPGHPAAAS